MHWKPYELPCRILDNNHFPESLGYTPGLDRVHENVISSHFMDGLAKDHALELYDDHEFNAKSLEINARTIYDRLIPSIFNASKAFCSDRAMSAKARARGNFRKFGLAKPSEVGVAQFITEVMFDRQYIRGPRESCSRELICNKVQRRVEMGLSIEMVIPALPYKFSSPLKTRGQLPDLAEVNFILELYEIVATIDLLYREEIPELRGPLARFTVASDGSRFNNIVNEPDSIIDAYRNHLTLWIEHLGLQRYITLIDYRLLLRDNLPIVVLEAKSAIRDRALKEYAETLWSILDLYNIAATLRTAAGVEPDPEYSNPEGRFVSLLTSLIFTVNYESLKKFKQLPPEQYRTLYRDLTQHVFEPFAILSPSELQEIRLQMDSGTSLVQTDRGKEYLRQSMLCEAWGAAIDYMAEIKSDRELEEDPIMTCLPDHFRWTIHAKRGQLAVLMPTALGHRVPAWAGAAVFKVTKTNKIHLRTLPVLALEGVGAIPVRVSGIDQALSLANQPFFYIYPDISFIDLDDFLSRIKVSLVRNRAS